MIWCIWFALTLLSFVVVNSNNNNNNNIIIIIIIIIVFVCWTCIVLIWSNGDCYYG